MSFVDNPYRKVTLPVVRVTLNGRPALVPMEVVGRGAVQAAFGIPRGIVVFHEHDGIPLGAMVHVFHTGDRYVGLYPATEVRVKSGHHEEAA